MSFLRAALCTCALILGLTCCGDSSGESLQPRTTTAADARLFGGCNADEHALNEADVIAEADLDGSGASNEIALVPQSAEGPCANALFTTFDGEPAAVPLDDLVLDTGTGSVEVIQLQGTAQQLLLVREEPHPRGGSQAHLFGYADSALSEVTTSGQPLLGFQASDGGGLPVTATCTEQGGLAVQMARPSEPLGMAPVWDVLEVTYSLEGTDAVKESATRIFEAVPDPALRRKMPQLFDSGGPFDDCVV